MTITDLPDEADEAAIFDFAMTFDGYDHFGSFEGSARAAASGDRSSLNLLRNELFFAARASRFNSDRAYVTVYRDLLPHLEALADDQ